MASQRTRPQIPLNLLLPLEKLDLEGIDLYTRSKRLPPGSGGTVEDLISYFKNPSFTLEFSQNNTGYGSAGTIFSKIVNSFIPNVAVYSLSSPDKLVDAFLTTEAKKTVDAGVINYSSTIAVAFSNKENLAPLFRSFKSSLTGRFADSFDRSFSLVRSRLDCKEFNCSIELNGQPLRIVSGGPEYTSSSIIMENALSVHILKKILGNRYSDTYAKSQCSKIILIVEVLFFDLLRLLFADSSVRLTGVDYVIENNLLRELDLLSARDNVHFKMNGTLHEVLHEKRLPVFSTLYTGTYSKQLVEDLQVLPAICSRESDAPIFDETSKRIVLSIYDKLRCSHYKMAPQYPTRTFYSNSRSNDTDLEIVYNAVDMYPPMAAGILHNIKANSKYKYYSHWIKTIHPLLLTRLEEISKLDPDANRYALSKEILSTFAIYDSMLLDTHHLEGALELTSIAVALISTLTRKSTSNHRGSFAGSGISSLKQLLEGVNIPPEGSNLSIIAALNPVNDNECRSSFQVGVHSFVKRAAGLAGLGTTKYSPRGDKVTLDKNPEVSLNYFTDKMSFDIVQMKLAYNVLS